MEDNTLIYQGYLEKVEGKKIPCFISRIFSRDQEGKAIIYEKIVYIDKEEINPDKKLVEQFSIYDDPKKIENFFQKKQIIEKSDSETHIIRRPVPDWILEKIEHRDMETQTEVNMLSRKKVNENNE